MTNKLSSFGAAPVYAHSVESDASGNVTKNGLALEEMTYDLSSNQLLSVKNTGNGVSYFFAYNGRNQRVVKSPNSNLGSGNKVYYYGNGKDALLTVFPDGTRSVNIYGPTGLISVLSAMPPTDPSQGTPVFILKDHEGSTRVVLNEDNSLNSSIYYWPFGAIIPGLSKINSSLHLSHFYTGQEYDPELDLYNFKARMYDANLCRFYSPDPLHQFPSPYIYSSNPISNTDASGDWFGIDDGITMVTGAAIGGLYGLAREFLMEEEISLGNVMASAGTGALSGQIALYGGLIGTSVFGQGLLGEAFAGAISGVASNGINKSITNYFSGKDWNEGLFEGAGSTALIGAGVAVVSFKLRTVEWKLIGDDRRINKRVGAEGESQARTLLRRRGFRGFHPGIQNKSGHGIDLKATCYSDLISAKPRYWYIEVKAHFKAGIPGLSNAQKKPEKYVRKILALAADTTKNRYPDPAVKRQAAECLGEFNLGNFQLYLINCDYALSWFPKYKIGDWEDWGNFRNWE